MYSGSIDLDALPGGLDLFATLESGQSYGWRREDGRCYEGDGPTEWAETAAPIEDAHDDEHHDGHSGRDARTASPWYTRVVDGDVLRVRQRGGRTDGALEWEAAADLESDLHRLLRLDDDLPAVLDDAPGGPLLDPAIDYAPGMRLVRDPPFETLIAFICSTQMRVARIHGMVTALADAYGEPVEFDGATYHSFPEPDALAAATEAELRDLGLGYRAPYVVETAELVASGELHPTDAVGAPYEQARETLTGFVGVGDKVADCVLLFSLDYLEAVPLDTWIQQAIAEHYPECDCGGYTETSRAIRERFGGEYAGYVQTYVFHYLRTQE